MAKSPAELKASMVVGLEEKTGKSIVQWVELAARCPDQKHGQIVKYLKSEHGLTHGYANLVAHELRASDSTQIDDGDLVDAQYSGAKSELRPIYERLVAAAKQLGKDVEISPKKTYVSLRRSKQFAIVQPSTKTRVDLGLNLKGKKPTKRLEASGSFNAMVSHRVRLTEESDVDEQVLGWLRAAYEQA